MAKPLAQKIKASLRNLAVVKWAVEYSKRLVLPGFQGLSVYHVTRFLKEGLQKGRINTRASAISFKVLLAFPPSLIVLLSLIPYIPIENFQENLMGSIAALLPHNAYDLVEGTLNDLLTRKHQTFLSISFILALIYTSNIFNAILMGFAHSYHVEVRRNAVRQQLLSFFLMLILSVIVIVGVGLITFSGVVFEYMRDVNIIGHDFIVFLLEIAKWLLVFFLFMLGISMLYSAGSYGRWKAFSAGALFATFGVIVVSLLFAWYVNNFGNYNKLYGSVGTILVVMLWLFFNTMVLLIGFEINTSIDKARAGIQPRIFPDDTEPLDLHEYSKAE